MQHRRALLLLLSGLSSWGLWACADDLAGAPSEPGLAVAQQATTPKAEDDLDDDGATNDAEASAQTDPNDADSDDDGALDGQEPSWDQDTDGDGLINALDPDSDDDGLFDGTELGLDASNPATDPAAGHAIPDADQGATTTDPLDPDTDDGSIKDGVEVERGTDPLDPSDDVPNDTNNGGASEGPGRIRGSALGGGCSAAGEAQGGAPSPLWPLGLLLVLLLAHRVHRED